MVERDPHGRLASVGWIALGLVGGGLCALLVWFAWLRETPLFWRNMGGYPVWLRTTVLWAFHPLLAVCFMGSVYLSWALLARWTGSSRLWAVQAGLVLLCWAMVGLSVLFAAANNISNIIDGRPLHSHIDEPPP